MGGGNTVGNLFARLGRDEGDPAVIAAREDARELGNLIQRLVRLRLARRIRQEDVAERMGTTQSAVSAFEHTGGDPKLSTVLRYARAVGARVRFGVEPDTTGGYRLAGSQPMTTTQDVIQHRDPPPSFFIPPGFGQAGPDDVGTAGTAATFRVTALR